jgi:hypothetical protein
LESFLAKKFFLAINKRGFKISLQSLEFAIRLHVSLPTNTSMDGWSLKLYEFISF